MIEIKLLVDKLRWIEEKLVYLETTPAHQRNPAWSELLELVMSEFEKIKVGIEEWSRQSDP